MKPFLKINGVLIESYDSLTQCFDVQDEIDLINNRAVRGFHNNNKTLHYTVVINDIESFYRCGAWEETIGGRPVFNVSDQIA